MKRFLTIAVCAAGLAACNQQAGDTTPVDNGAAAAGATSNDVGAQMAQLNERQLNAVLIRAILDAGMPCEGVTKSERVTTTQTPTWRATCQNGVTHTIEVSPDGTAKVISPTRQQ